MYGTCKTGACFDATKGSLRATTVSPLPMEELTTASWPVEVKVCLPTK